MAKLKVAKGDKLELLDDVYVAKKGATVTVDYILPSYGKIIVIMDEPVRNIDSMCLYEWDQEKTWRKVF